MTCKLYVCGSNGQAQLGLGHDQDKDELCLVEFVDTRVAKIVGGGNHTMVLLETGEIYSAGENLKGQLGRGGDGSKFMPVRAGGTLWKNVACGWEFSVLVSVENTVYACGHGDKGELGLGPENYKIKSGMVPVCDMEEDIIDIQAGLNCVIVRLASGLCYGWGYNKQYQLCELLEKKIWTPQLLARKEDYAIGRDYVIWSDLSISGRDRFSIEPGTCASKVLSMWSSVHMFAEKENKNYSHEKSYGNNSHGQILTHSDAQTNKIISDITKVTVGSEHGVILHNNSVYCWGWGEHGNCGKQTDSQLTQVPVPTPNAIYYIAAGCSTTFVCTE